VVTKKSTGAGIEVDVVVSFDLRHTNINVTSSKKASASAVH
jgi:hypothetical protein